MVISGSLGGGVLASARAGGSGEGSGAPKLPMAGEGSRTGGLSFRPDRAATPRRAISAVPTTLAGRDRMWAVAALVLGGSMF